MSLDRIIPLERASEIDLEIRLIEDEIRREEMAAAKAAKREKRKTVLERFADDQDRVERAARMYHTNTAAAKALETSSSSFKELCEHWKIETPAERKKRLKAEAQAKPKEERHEDSQETTRDRAHA